MATQQQTADLAVWLDQYTAAVARADAGAVAATWAAYAAVDDWDDPAQTLLAAGVAMSAAEAVRSTNAGLMSEFLAVVGDLFGLTRLRPLRVVPEYPRDADPFDVYSRPVFTYREAITAGEPPAVAEEEAQHRAEVISLTDAQLVRREAAARTLEEAGVTKYRRIIRPELSATGTCGLCIAAATRVYKVSQLLPIHSRCKCTVLPILDGLDPGDINAADLEQIYATIPATKRGELSRFRYQVTDDSEIGPALSPATAA